MKKCITILLFSIFTSIIVFCQGMDLSYCDSVLSKNTLSLEEFEKIDSILFTLNYYRSDSVRLLYQRAIVQAEANGFIELSIRFEIWLADLLYEIFLPDSGLYYANHAAERALELGDSLLYARTANVRRLVYTTKNDFETAFKICFEALDIFENYQDDIGKSVSLRDIGSILMQEEKYEEALDYCLRAIPALEAVKYWYELTFTYQRVAIAYRNLGNYQLAQHFIQKAMDACRQLHGFRVEQGLAKKYWTRGYIYEAQENFNQAGMNYDSSLYFARIIGYPVDKWIYNSKGELHLKRQNYAAALAEFQKALQIINGAEKRQRGYDYYLPVYSNLVKAHEGLGQYKEAYQLSQLIANSKDSIFRLESEKQVSELKMQYETEQKEALINQLELEKAVQFRFLVLGGILLISLVLLALILWRNIRFRMMVNQTLKLQKEEIEEKNSQNELLLREIHHRVKNNLQILSSLLNLQSEYIKDESALNALTEGRNRVQSMSFIHQQLYSEQNVSMVDMREYVPLLCGHLRDSFSLNNNGIRIKYLVNVPFIDVETAIPLGLIINELITNSIKYAFPEPTDGEIMVRLWIGANEKLFLRVMDNGSKISDKKEGSSSSFGTDLINVLSQKLKGKITVERNNGYSTTIEFSRFRIFEHRGI